ncbi:MAG: imidazole glycerol phosphate synthase subunit HisH [bacterium]|jgi:glutamine amidotransferase
MKTDNNGPSVAVIDYGMGNLRSVQKGLEKVGCSAIVSSDPSVIASSDGIVLPGVGAYRDCMSNLTQAKLVDTVQDAVREGKPFLGICLGMQILMSISEEFGLHQGLDLVPGRVVKFPPNRDLKVPHMGWNRVYSTGPNPFLKGIPDGSFFYFVHSYYAEPESEDMVATWTDYGLRFCSSISTGNLFACQFHPEKSQRWGLKLLENFGEIVAEYQERN